MPKKSVFRQPGAQHFQLVHRSQRDPAIHDPDASQHVLKAFERENTKKGKSRADLESVISASDLVHDLSRANIGEASLYGVYYDDTDYDYMQHLRNVGESEEGVDSVLLEAPLPTKSKIKGKQPALIPHEALPSKVELQPSYESQLAVPTAIAGFQPDMDPHLRQVLEALEDDAFVDESLEDGFFDELVKDGERDEDSPLEFEFREEGIEDEELDVEAEKGGERDGASHDDWEARFKQFKKEQQFREAQGSDVDDDSEGGDTIGRLPELSVVGGKRRRKGASDASGYSMSSSSMFRNQGLQTLDEQFDRIEKEYDSDGLEDDVDEPESHSDSEVPELITTREDFNAIMDDFLENYEKVGRKLRPVLPGDTGAEKLETLRRAMVEDEDGVLKGIALRSHLRQGNEREDVIPMPHDVDEEKDRWDCETILSTYTTLENHPRLIRVREDKAVPKITLNPKTGLPSVEGSNSNARNGHREEIDSNGQNDRRETITRPRNESKEDKKARKKAVKEERQARRIDKKATREQFSAERKHQVKAMIGRDKASLKKL